MARRVSRRGVARGVSGDLRMVLGLRGLLSGVPITRERTLDHHVTRLSVSCLIGGVQLGRSLVTLGRTVGGLEGRKLCPLPSGRCAGGCAVFEGVVNACMKEVTLLFFVGGWVEEEGVLSSGVEGVGVLLVKRCDGMRTALTRKLHGLKRRIAILSGNSF